jgi:hypothetical protein
MEASMVPACSEIVPDPPPVQTENLTNGELSAADFKTWLQADRESFTLLEWAVRHGQANMVRFLGWSPNVANFVRAGGEIRDSQACAYVEKVSAVALTSGQMIDLTDSTISVAGIAYAQATFGPCSSVWTAANGVVQQEGLTAGEEFRELDITTIRTSLTVGDYVVFVSHWPQDAANTTVTVELNRSGI